MSARAYLVPIDLKQLELRNPVLHLLASAPGSPVAGQLFYNTSTGCVEFRNGSSWIVLGTLDQISAPQADLSLNGHKITSLGTPASTTDAATKGYVDGLISGVATWKIAARAATTVAGTLASSFAGGSVVDGVTLTTGDRVLIKNQATGSENGIYTVNASGAPTRAADADAGTELLGAAVWIEEGTTNADTGWVQTVDGTITLGTTTLTWSKFASASADPTVAHHFSADVGDGISTAIDVVHNFGTLDVLVQVYVKGSGGALVDCDVVHKDTNTATLNFAVAPTAAQYRATCIA